MYPDEEAVPQYPPVNRRFIGKGAVANRHDRHFLPDFTCGRNLRRHLSEGVQDESFQLATGFRAFDAPGQKQRGITDKKRRLYCLEPLFGGLLGESRTPLEQWRLNQSRSGALRGDHTSKRSQKAPRRHLTQQHADEGEVPRRRSVDAQYFDLAMHQSQHSGGHHHVSRRAGPPLPIWEGEDEVGPVYPPSVSGYPERHPGGPRPRRLQSAAIEPCAHHHLVRQPLRHTTGGGASRISRHSALHRLDALPPHRQEGPRSQAPDKFNPMAVFAHRAKPDWVDRATMLPNFEDLMEAGAQQALRAEPQTFVAQEQMTPAAPEMPFMSRLHPVPHPAPVGPPPVEGRDMPRPNVVMSMLGQPIMVPDAQSFSDPSGEPIVPILRVDMPKTRPAITIVRAPTPPSAPNAPERKVTRYELNPVRIDNPDGYLSLPPEIQESVKKELGGTLTTILPPGGGSLMRKPPEALAVLHQKQQEFLQNLQQQLQEKQVQEFQKRLQEQMALVNAPAAVPGFPGISPASPRYVQGPLVKLPAASDPPVTIGGTPMMPPLPAQHTLSRSITSPAPSSVAGRLTPRFHNDMSRLFPPRATHRSSNGIQDMPKIVITGPQGEEGGALAPRTGVEEANVLPHNPTVTGIVVEGSQGAGKAPGDVGAQFESSDVAQVPNITTKIAEVDGSRLGEIMRQKIKSFTVMTSVRRNLSTPLDSSLKKLTTEEAAGEVVLVEREINVYRVLKTPELLEFENFLSDYECSRILQIAEASGWRPVITTSAGSDTKREGSTSSSSASSEEEEVIFAGDSATEFKADVKAENNPLVEALLKRISRMLNVAPSRIQALQAVKFLPGGSVRMHTDGTSIERIFLLYLNDVPAGGETGFSELGVAITPKKGYGLAWNNLCTADGTVKVVDARTAHGSLPVAAGVKYCLPVYVKQN